MALMYLRFICLHKNRKIEILKVSLLVVYCSVMKPFLKALTLICLAAAIASCGSKTYKNIDYLQNVLRDTTMSLNTNFNEGIIVQPKDMISIVVTSRNPELSAMFNLASVTYQAGSESGVSGGYQRIMGYSVDEKGDIDFPILGKLHVAGLNRWGVAEVVKNELVRKNLLKDAVVTVEFLNFKISVVGEVSRPGTFNVTGDRINILEAISLAGDLTIYGKRDNVTVIREQNGKRQLYKIDLRDTELFKSPAYYLQQNDVVYVQPNKVRAGQSTINENSFRSVSFWTTLSASFLSIANLIVTISKNN